MSDDELFSDASEQEKVKLWKELQEEGLRLGKRGLYKAAEECLERAFQLADELDDDEKRVKTNGNLAVVYRKTGRNRQARELLEDIYEADLDPLTNFRALLALAVAVYNQGFLRQGLLFAEQARKIAAELNDDRQQARVLNTLGRIHLFMMEYSEAVPYYREAMKLVEENEEYKTDYSYYEENLGFALLLAGRIDEGIDNLSRSLFLARQLDNHWLIADSLKDLCYGFYLKGEYSKAEKFGRDALQIAEADGYEETTWYVLYFLGKIRQKQGNRTEAVELFKRAERLQPAIGHEFLLSADVDQVLVPQVRHVEDWTHDETT